MPPNPLGERFFRDTAIGEREKLGDDLCLGRREFVAVDN
jgi:hypothetical protein